MAGANSALRMVDLEADYPRSVDQVQCFGCGAMVPDQDGPVHKYMLSVPGCWALYGAVLAWVQERPPGRWVTARQHVVDCYAAQHATNPERRNRQSVAGHLMSLCASIEHGVTGDRLRTMIGGWTHRDYPLLDPRPSGYPVTVREVAWASETSRPDIVGDWAITTWEAWSAHHDTIRAWLASALDRKG